MPTIASSSCHRCTTITTSTCCSNSSNINSSNIPKSTVGRVSLVGEPSSNTCPSHNTTAAATGSVSQGTQSRLTTRRVSPPRGRTTKQTDTKTSFIHAGSTLGICQKEATPFLLGLATAAAGFLLGVGALRIASTTESTQEIERPLPILAEASVMVLAGLTAMLSSRKRYKLLIVVSIILSFVSSLFCFASFVYLLTDVNVSLKRLQDCTFQRDGNVCQCFVSSTHGRRVFRFSAVDSCAAVQNNLRELVYGVCILFGVGFVISCATMVVSCYLLYTEHKKAIAERRRSSGDGCNELTSITTQTHDTAFDDTLPSEAATQRMDAATGRGRRATNNTSVATQTPMYMMPVAQLVYDMSASVSDYRPVNLLLADRDEPPPPYTDTFI